MSRKTVNVLSLLLLFVIILIFWNTSFVFPIKILVIFFHELSHGLASIATGGKIAGIEIYPEIGGRCVFSGGFLPLIIPAGYIGSIVFGGVILLISSYSHLNRVLSIALGFIIIIISYFFIMTEFGLIFGMITGAAFIIIGTFAPVGFNSLILKFIGVTSLLYKLIDIKSDLIDNNITHSDAYMMSLVFPLPPVFWGILWFSISCSFVYIFLRIYIKD